MKDAEGRIRQAMNDADQRRNLIGLLEIMVSQGPARPGQIIDHLTNHSLATLHYCLVDWVNSQNPEFGRMLEDLAASDIMRRWLYDALNRAKIDHEFVQAKARSRVRTLYLAEIFSGIEDVAVPIGVINEETGLPNKVDMLYVCAIAKYLQSAKIFEFGTYMGRTTFYLAQTTPECFVHTLNLPVALSGEYAPYIGAYWERRGKPSNIHQLFSNSRELDVESLRGQMDLVFIDGDHSFEMVENDTRKALALLKPGGMVVWHDYAAKTPGVYNFIERFSLERSVFHIKNTALAVYRDGIDAMTFEAFHISDSLESKFYARADK
jgi:predicted O-methyltransferase YrrM